MDELYVREVGLSVPPMAIRCSPNGTAVEQYRGVSIKVSHLLVAMFSSSLREKTYSLGPLSPLTGSVKLVPPRRYHVPLTMQEVIPTLGLGRGCVVCQSMLALSKSSTL